MKRSLLPAFITAVLGFAAGWFLKPAPPIPATAFAKKSAPARHQPKVSPADPPAPEPTTPAATSLPQPPVARIGEESQTAAGRDAAKMARLVEALHLSPQQQDQLVKIIADAQAAGAPAGSNRIEPGQIVPTALATGAMIEKSLAGLLSPEQAAAFEALRQRSRENLIETAAQTQLAANLKQVDLTPAQRAEALARVREAAAAKIADRPAALDLALDISVLPTGSAAIAAESLGGIQDFADGADPILAQKKLMARHRAELDAQAKLYDGILSPAQLAQYKSAIEEQRRTLDRLDQILK